MNSQEQAKNLYNIIVDRLINPSDFPGVKRNEARTITFWLLENSLGVSWTEILMNKTLEIDEASRNKLNEAVQRILHDEPVQYVLGSMEFYGRKFAVNPSVLIPRRETEELVNLIIRENKYNDDLHVLDLGTGSGCIAITLAKELNRAVVTGVDNYQEALNIAEENGRYHKVNVHWILADITHSNAKIFGDNESEPWDIIVSNPPYVRRSEMAHMENRVLNHEPLEALIVDDDEPLFFYRKIMELINGETGGKKLLKEGGQLYFEINEAMGEKTGELLAASGFGEIKIFQDMQGKDRVVYGQYKPE